MSWFCTWYSASIGKNRMWFHCRDIRLQYTPLRFMDISPTSPMQSPLISKFHHRNLRSPSCKTISRVVRWFGEGLSMLFTLIVLVHGSLVRKIDKEENRRSERCGGFTYSRWWFQIFCFTPTWGNDPIWRAYFSNGLKPPTGYPE